jgi:hypothetical protein
MFISEVFIINLETTLWNFNAIHDSMSPTEMPEIKTSGSPWVVEI